MNIKLANTLFNEGVLSELYKAGFFTEKILTYQEIYLWVDVKLKVNRLSKEEAVSQAKIHFKKDRSTIYRTLQKFR